MFDGARGDLRRPMLGKDEMQVDIQEEEKEGGSEVMLKRVSEVSELKLSDWRGSRRAKEDPAMVSQKQDWDFGPFFSSASQASPQLQIQLASCMLN
jgi:hypothetical protein